MDLMNETERLEEADSLPLTEAFAQGKVFSVDVLDSLMAAVSHQEACVPVLLPPQSSPGFISSGCMHGHRVQSGATPHV